MALKLRLNLKKCKRGDKIVWQNWIIGILGIWLIISSFTIHGNLLNELIVGISVAILGFWMAIQSQF